MTMKNSSGNEEQYALAWYYFELADLFADVYVQMISVRPRPDNCQSCRFWKHGLGWS